MSNVEIHLFAAARAAVGMTVVPAAAGRLSTILDRLAVEFPNFATVRPQCSYLVDGVSAQGETDVPSGSRVDVLPPFAGG
ncbi:MAG: MoaD/ThiS family protein [Actinobacteria bacterium]|nr:MoaD/ThiS family protein [Actinomycetota bacterium]